VKRVRSLFVLGLVLACTVFVVPDSSVRVPSIALVRTDTVQGVDHARNVVWILCLGSDARPGEMPLRTRADAIQMVGVNLRTGTGAVLGVPRDSWVDIPGHGYERINAALSYGGPQLMGRTVGNLVGVQPDYVFVTTFTGFRSMIQAVGGVTVHSRLAFTDDNMIGNIRRGVNHLDGAEALFFSRARHFLPRGDFDRSANQQEMLRAILRQVRSHASERGFMERSMLSVVKNLYTNMSPRELYTLAQNLTVIDPARFRGCVVNGSIGDVNGASIVFPDRAQAQRLGADARNDARLDRVC
jgi:LCP family protein required for cell wall assembly